MVVDPADFYALDVVSLSRLDGLGEKSAAKLVKAIEVSQLLKLMYFNGRICIFSARRIPLV